MYEIFKYVFYVNVFFFFFFFFLFFEYVEVSMILTYIIVLSIAKSQRILIVKSVMVFQKCSYSYENVQDFRINYTKDDAINQLHPQINYIVALQKHLLIWLYQILFQLYTFFVKVKVSSYLVVLDTYLVTYQILFQFLYFLQKHLLIWLYQILIQLYIFLSGIMQHQSQNVTQICFYMVDYASLYLV
eukprot:TRINITY_DN9800_c0_g1_i15.p3 TRINITY_DN9800_c0_g1~~TRINITY_DN9800_c0_g1_i15.p3  ORF type:complete len:207 (-),score=-9.24 TRINITY_DN9800_c0_g1_i15:395-955(-)